jgi:hypothetical protein
LVVWERAEVVSSLGPVTVEGTGETNRGRDPVPTENTTVGWIYWQEKGRPRPEKSNLGGGKAADL